MVKAQSLELYTIKNSFGGRASIMPGRDAVASV